MSEIMKSIELSEEKERGQNVEIVLKFMRHGERDREGNLLDIGRDITRQKAQESGIQAGDFDAVKAIGSDASPISDKSGMPRALETAHIYAQEIEGDDAFNTRVNSVLNYETLVTKAPYNHKEVYNSYLPDDFDEISSEEKILASKIANLSTINHIFHLKGDEAEKFRKEIAGSSAYVIDHYIKMTKKLNNGSRILIPAGGHGSILEFILQRALVFKGEDGKTKTGFDDLSEIGGDFNPSEAFSIGIKTDDNGDLETVTVSFDSPDRPRGDMSLDIDKVKELSEFYQLLHPVKKWARD